MTSLLSVENPTFRYYVLASLLLFVKQYAANFWVGFSKQIAKVVMTPEDRLFAGSAAEGPTAGKFGIDHPNVKRAYAIVQNDFENIFIFYFAGLLYVATGGTEFWGRILFFGFVAARYLHSMVYWKGLQPHRALCFFSGFGCSLGLIVMTFLNVWKHMH